MVVECVASVLSSSHIVPHVLACSWSLGELSCFCVVCVHVFLYLITVLRVVRVCPCPSWYMLFGNCYPCTGGTWWLPALIGGIGFAVIGLLSFTGVLSAGRWHMIRQAASLVQVTSLQISIGIPWPDFVDISFSMFEGFFGEFGV